MDRERDRRTDYGESEVLKHQGLSAPSVHNPELAARFCETLASGMTLREVCPPEEMPALDQMDFGNLERFSVQHAVRN
jgi:hypothetical protein